MKQYKMTTLCINIMTVNGVMFFVSVDPNIKFGTVNAVPDKSMKTCKKVLRKIVGVYSRQEFQVSCVECDMASIKMQETMPKVMLSPTFRDEHITK